MRERDTTGQQSDNESILVEELQKAKVRITELESEVEVLSHIDKRIDSIDTRDLETQQLQEQVKSLDAKLKYTRKQKKEFEEELAAVERENRDLKQGEAMQRIVNKLMEAEAKIQSTLTENQKLKKLLEQQAQSQIPATAHLELVRDRVVEGWKVAKRAESKDRIKLAIDRFISQLPPEEPTI